MDLGLEGKVALVAGASRGLGRAIAKELAAEGATLVLCARGEDGLREAGDAIVRAHGRAVTLVAADLSRADEPRRVVEAGLRAHGRIDVLVTNAGGPPHGEFESHGPEAWEAAVHLTLRSAVELIRAVLPGMKQRRWGRIVNVTSVAVKQPIDGLVLSNAIRAAVTGMARTLANETAAHGITVNNALPDYTRTDRVVDLAAAMAASAGTTPEAIVARWEEQTPARRLGEPNELAALTAFLASERAGYITGQSIAVDGGWIRGVL
jgi:3-oxoacyl-[acyl-carrier protein] reductase